MENTIIEASAGSGKTFQLSNRYIDLVCQGVDAENILASTFTKKAAGEILDRILSKLGEASLDDEKLRKTKRNEKTGELFIKSLPDRKEELQPIVAKLVRQLYKMRVSTLDSFFNKIAAAFSLEIGLPAGWTMVAEDDTERMFTLAVVNVLRESNRNNVKKILADFQKGESQRSIISELVGIAKDYLALYRTTEKEHCWVHNELLQDELNKTDIQQAIRVLDSVPAPPIKRADWAGAFEARRKEILKAASQQDWQTVCGIGIVQNTLNGKKSYGIEFERDLWDSIETLGKQALIVEINKIVGITAATYELLKLIAIEYEKIAKKEAGYRFDDVTDKLCTKHDQFSLDSPELLSHRLNAPANHLLLDEFQDTSIPQWSVLDPFTTNAKSSGSVFVVGDKKQSIYAWRGGVAQIFDTVRKTLGIEKPDVLAESFRSSPHVIEMVNKIFNDIENNKVLQEKEEYSDAAKAWGKNFVEHKTARKDLPGYFSVEIAPDTANEVNSDEDESGSPNNFNDDEKAGSRTDPYSDYVAKQIITLRQEKPNASIGVLVGRNREIGKIIDSLRKLAAEQKIDIEASEEGGVALTDSNAVQVVLSAMKLADHPGDKTALFHLIYSPLRKALDLPEKFPDQIEDKTQRVEAAYKARKCSTEIRNAIIKTGYGKTIKKYTEWLADSCNERDYEKLKKLTELAYQFDDEASGVRTQRFLKRVEAARVDSPKAEKIHVMNYFGSKGLEFDIVVLPDFNEKLSKHSPQYIVSRDTPAEPVNWVLKYINSDLQTFLPNKDDDPKHYRKAFSDRIKNEVIERLCILYVAMTRARYETLMIVPPKKVTKTPEKLTANFTGIVFSGLGIEKYAGIAGVIKEHGDKKWYKNSELAQKTKENEAANKPLVCKLGKTKMEDQHWVPVAPSSLEAAAVESAPQTGVPYREKAALYGTAMHRCFEAGLKGDWLDDGLKDDAELKELVQEVLITEPNGYSADAIVADFKKNIEKPNVKKNLTAPAEKPGTKIEVEAERRFAIRDDSSKKVRLLHGSIDRLVIHRNQEGKATEIEILDYKTGSQDKSVYAEQMLAYRIAASKLYDIDGTNIKTSLVYVDRDEIVEI